MSTPKSKKGFESALNLPDVESLSKMLGLDSEVLSTEIDTSSSSSLSTPEPEERVPSNMSLKEAQDALGKLRDMRVQLRDIPELAARKVQLNRMADIAEQKFNDIFDRSVNCEDKYMTDMINAATNLLKVALEAHTRILEADIKITDLQIKKDKIELDFNNKPQPTSTPGERDVNVVDEGPVQASINRNDVLGSGTKHK